MSSLSELGPGLPRLARQAIRAWCAGEPRSAPDSRPGTPAAPVFVTLRDARGELRGCIGTLEPTQPDVCAETARSAVLAASEDPRFSPVAAAELPALSIEVSVLLPAEPARSEADLDPLRFGVIVRDRGGRRGVLLPAVPGIDSPHSQVTVARRKAGIPDAEPVSLERFRVLKFLE